MRKSASVLMALCGLLAGSARAYYHFTHYPVRGKAGVVEKFDLSSLVAKTVYFYVSSQGPTALAPDDSISAVISQLRLAASAWNDVQTSDLKVAYGGVIAPGTASSTPAIQVIFDEVPPGLIALGGPTVWNDVNSSGATPFIPIRQSTLILRKDLTSQPSSSERFFLSAVHEFGHTLGLQHTLTSSVMSTDLTRGTTKSQPLGLDDIAGLSVLYPTASFLTDSGSISGRVVAPDGAVTLASVVAYTPTGQGVSAFTAPDGTYRIDGLAPGQYSLYVHALPPPVSSESAPAGLRLPTDEANNPISPSAAFDLQFYPAGRDWSQALPVSVTAGQLTSGIDFNVQRRGKQSIYAVQTYGFPNGATTAVKPPIFSLDGTKRPFVVSAGFGIVTTNGSIVSGLQAGVIGDPTLISGLQPYYYPGYLQMNLALSPTLPEGPRHVLFQTSTDAYVLMNAFSLTAHQPPAITNVASGQDGQGRKTIAISGTGFTSRTRFLLNGVLISATPTDDSLSQFQAIVPPGPAGEKAVVAALNPDGQSSLQVQGDARPTFTYDSQSGFAAASLAPVVTLSPATIPAGVETVIDVTASSGNFSDSLNIGFANPDVVATKTVVLGPNHALVDVVTSPSAAAASVAMTLTNGLQVVQPSGQLQVVNGGAKAFVFSTSLSNPAAPPPAAFSGGTAVATLVSQPYGLSGVSNLTVTLNGTPVPATAVNDNQISFFVPATIQGYAILRLQAGSDQSLPALISIAPPPSRVLNILGRGGLPVTAQRPAQPGDSVTLWVSGLSDSDVNGKFIVTIGGVDHQAVRADNLGSGGILTVTFNITSQTPTGTPQATVQVNGKTTLPFTLPVRP